MINKCKLNKKSDPAFVGSNDLRIKLNLSQAVGLLQNPLDLALRTYATWLVRAARNKPAESGGIDLTSASNNRSSSVNIKGVKDESSP